MEAIRDAAWIGTWALVWRSLRRLHVPFRTIDITDESPQQLSIFTELQQCHASLLARHDTLAAIYAGYDRHVYDFCRAGLAH